MGAVGIETVTPFPIFLFLISQILLTCSIQISIELLHNSSGIVSSQFPLKIHGFLLTDIGNGCLFFIKESCFSMFFGKELV